MGGAVGRGRQALTLSWLGVYHALPYPLRVVAASLRGFQLRLWRYGPETDRLADETQERETWSDKQWQAWQGEKLARLLDRAATRVPYYRQAWEQRRRQGDRASWSYLENWPILDKESIRQRPRSFVADDCDPRRMFHEHTSGTTGKPLDLWWSRRTVREWYALFEARCRRWHEVSRHDRWAILGGQLVTPIWQRRPPFWVWNHGLNQLYMSSYHLAPDLVSHYLDAIKAHKVRYLWGYTSSLFALAQEALRQGRRELGLAVAITNAEPLFEHQRQAIALAFDCPVRETYGMAEIVAAASECQAGQLHLWPEVGIIEPDAASQPTSDPGAGAIIATGLLNADMPLIRYCVGDRASVGQFTQPCECGRSLPRVAYIDGRADELLYTTDGRVIGRLDTVFKETSPIREAQIVQEEIDLVRIRFVPAPEYSLTDGLALATRLQERMGPIRVELEAVERLPRASSGKFRAVVNRMRNGAAGHDVTPVSS
jgi:phenylacetate-CoA ligase